MNRGKKIKNEFRKDILLIFFAQKFQIIQEKSFEIALRKKWQNKIYGKYQNDNPHSPWHGGRTFSP